MPTTPRIWFQAQTQSQLSPVIEVVGLKSSCVPVGGTSVGSLSQLESLTTTPGGVSYFKDAAGTLFLRLRGHDIYPQFRSENAISATTSPITLSCP